LSPAIPPCTLLSPRWLSQASLRSPCLGRRRPATT